MNRYDRGSAIIIEVEFKKSTPFGGETYFDPISPTITIYQQGKTPKVEDASLTQSAVGKYFYIVQTEEDWDSGAYLTRIDAADATYSDVTIQRPAFELI